MASNKETPLAQKNVAIIALTENGRLLAHQVKKQLTDAEIYLPVKRIKDTIERKLPGSSFQEGVRELFALYDYLICIMATGIVVRSVAPALLDKYQDPAVLVLDEKGQFVISLLSGHVGGGNQLASELAAKIKAIPVITTATDVQNVTALDLLAKEVTGYYRESKENARLFNGLLAAHELVGLYQEKKWVKDTRGLTNISELRELPEELKALIVVSEMNIILPDMGKRPIVQVVPRAFVLGIGARKNISAEAVMEAFTFFCGRHGINQRSIGLLVSIELKKEEKGIQSLAHYLNCPFETYSAEELEEASEHYPNSAFVKKTVGVGNVASACAHVASGGKVLTERFSHNGVTLVLGEFKNEAQQT